MGSPPGAVREPAPRLALYLALGYLLLVAYASLAPFTGWSSPGVGALAFLAEPWPRYQTRFDLAINFAAYVPFGALVTLALASRLRPWLAAGVAALAGAALSVALEATQMYLPGRFSTVADVACNTLGTLAGAVLATWLGPRRALVAQLGAWRERVFLPGGGVELGMALVAVWFATQLNPALPLFGAQALPDRLPIAGTGFIPPREFSLYTLGSVALHTLGVSLFVATLVRRRGHALAAMVMLLAAATAIKLAAGFAMLKPQAVFIWLPAEAALGLLAGMTAATAALVLRRRRIAAVAATTLAAAFVLIHLAPEGSRIELLWPFRWSYGQLLNYTGLARATTEVWPLAAILWLAWFRFAGPGRDPDR